MSDGGMEGVMQPPPSCLNKVPNEILAQIFTAGTEEWSAIDPGGFPFPVLVSVVCRHWRTLSLNSPNLWTFVVPPLVKTNPTECLRWTSDWMKRSGEMAVSVLLDDSFLFTPTMLRVSDGDTLDPGDLAALILNLVRLQCSHRLRRVDIHLKGLSTPIRKAMESIANTKPPLQELSMCTTNSPQAGPPRYLEFSDSSELSWLAQLPNLRTFRFQDTFHMATTTPAAVVNRYALPFCLSALTSLDLSQLGPHTLAEVDRFFGDPQFRVQYLVLRHLHPSVPSGDRPAIRIDTVRTLAVSTAEKHRGDSQSRFILCLFIFPNLTYLEIDSDVRISTLFENSISTSKIDTLKIINRLPVSLAHRDHLPSKHKEDMDIFRSLHSLQSLELIRAQISIRVLLFGLFSENGTEVARKRSINFRHWASNDAQNAAPEQPGVFWPHLHSITLDTMFAEDVKSLIDFVKLHESVQEIALSSSAMRNLADLRRKGEEIILPVPGLFKYREGMSAMDEEITSDVSEWLSKRVRVINSRRSNADMLLWERPDRAPALRRRSAS